MQYLFNLNYWNTNTLFLILITSVFIQKWFRLLIFFFFNFFINFNPMLLYFFKKELPETLLIGTITIHPLMFYFFMFIFFFKNIRLLKVYLLNICSFTNTNLIVFLSVTLLLGGFWGLQSTIWGYFWVNDAVEWLLLCAILYLIYKVHSFEMPHFSYNFFILILFLLNLIFLVRLNIFQTRHNFISQQNVHFFIFSFYLIFVVFLVNWSSKFKRYLYKRSSITRLFTFFFFICMIKFYGLFFCKYITLFLIVYFFYRFSFLNTFSLLMFHLLFFGFYLVWSLYFTFFYVTYKHMGVQSEEWPLYFSNYYLYLNHFSSQNVIFTFLEIIKLFNFSDLFRYFNVWFGNASFVILNNSHLLYWLGICFILFVKSVEFRLLYD